jgi:hypothetical protein
MKKVAFLFLGETLLIPHLWPIAEALAEAAPDVPIDLWVSTSIHEEMLGRWSQAYPSMRLRRAPGYRACPGLPPGTNPPLPAKLPMLARLAPLLLGTRVAVCAEQTSLWIPTALPFHPTRFVRTAHGAGPINARGNRRQRAAKLLMEPSETERQAFIAQGVRPERIVVTGYIKALFRQRTPASALFADARPILLYNPHWQRHRSSWWAWGRQIVALLAEQTHFNVIIAPHQRLVERDPTIREVMSGVAHLAHVHADLESFAMVDGSYPAAADLYLGDTSSQVVEYMARPRPCVFLNPDRLDWQSAGDHGFWECGNVIDDLATLPEALASATKDHVRYAAVQKSFAERALGDTSERATKISADQILRNLQR